ncbi:20852_t:CDS:2, partial [Gigaspora rosea]
STQSVQQQVSSLSSLPSVSSTQQASLMGGEPSINEIHEYRFLYAICTAPASLLSGQFSINNIQGTLQSGQCPYFPLNYPLQYIPLKDLQLTVPTQLGQIPGQVSFQV